MSRKKLKHLCLSIITILNTMIFFTSCLSTNSKTVAPGLTVESIPVGNNEMQKTNEVPKIEKPKSNANQQPIVVNISDVDFEALRTSFFEPLRAGDPQSHPLPLWYEENRVQAHSILPIQLLNEQGFIHAAEGFKALGVGVFDRHVKTGREDPWWPSSIPLAPDGQPLLYADRTVKSAFIPKGRNVVQEMIDEAHRQNLRIITYYWIHSDETMASLYPEAVCGLPGGNNAAHKNRGDYLDITYEPYREAVKTRLLELAAMGTDGIFFDNTHLPADGCWGTNVEKEFIKATGLAAPKAIDVKDPVYLLYLDWQAAKIAETFKYWQDAVHSKYPDVIFAVSGTSIPALTKRTMSTDLIRIADVTKNEYKLSMSNKLGMEVFEKNATLLRPNDDIRLAIGWTLLRDSADGRPPRIGGKIKPNGQHALGFAASLVTHGAVANLAIGDADVLESAISGIMPKVNKNELQSANANELALAFELGKKVSPYMSQSRPLRWAAVYFSENSRDRRGGDFAKAWREVLWPVVGAFGVLTRDRLPVGLVNDYQLEKGQLDGYQVLFLPNADELTSAQKDSVAKFKDRGGIIIANNPAWEWSTEQGNEAAQAAFRAAIQPYLSTAPFYVTGGPESMHVIPFRQPQTNRLVINFSNDISWIQDANEASRGKGKVAFDGETGDKIVSDGSINAPPHSINGVEVMIKADCMPDSVLEVVSGKKLPVTAVNGGFKVKLPEFQYMAMLIVE